MSENLYRKVTAEEIEYEKQESRYRFMLDMNTIKSVADREGFERGAAQEKRENAKKMMAEGIDVEIVSRITGLSFTELETL